MGEKCCFCFPLDCGVKTLCVLYTISAIAAGAYSYLYPDFKDMWLPFSVSLTILSIVWIMAWISPTESAKNMVFLAFIVCNLVFNYGYRAFLLLNGKVEEFQCRPETLQQMN